ncbi:MAG TPA: D-2-hydroxyacid dehydrogenase [Trebonia sp.]|nr:D-2-hydroxyacid dehydrogenase [Trebonia sp.]
MVYAKDDPDIGPPPWELLETAVEVVPADGTASVAAEVLYVWDHRLADLGALLRAAPQVRWVHANSVGVDRLLCPELRGRTLTNARGVFDTAITEWVVAAVLAHVKGLARTWERQRQRVWEHRVTGRLAGRTAAVVGTGSIGRAIAAGLAALGVRVELIGRAGRPGTTRGSDQLAEVARDADILVLALPLTAETTGLVDAAVLDALGPAGFLVNVGRGRCVVQSDLAEALRSGAIAGAALDVFEAEPLPATSPLWTLPNVLISPHMSGDYVGFEADMMRIFAANLDRWLAGQPLHNVVELDRGYVPG